MLSSGDDSEKSGSSDEIAYQWTSQQIQFKAAGKKLQVNQSSNRTVDHAERLVAPPLGRAPPTAFMNSDDDYSEVEIGPNGSRMYRPRPGRSHLYQGSGSQSTSIYTGYNRSQWDTQSARSNRDTSPMSIQSTRSINPYNAEELYSSLREALELNILPLQAVTKLTQEFMYPSRKRRRRGRDSSNDRLGSSSEDERHSTRSEFPAHRFKRPRNATLRPCSSQEIFDQRRRDVSYNSFNSSQVNKSSMSKSNFSKTLLPSFNSSRSVENMQNNQRRVVNLKQPRSQPPVGSLTLQLQSMQNESLRSLRCTEVTDGKGQKEKTLVATEEAQCSEREPQTDHVFIKPKTLPQTKKNVATASMSAPSNSLPEEKNNVLTTRMATSKSLPESQNNVSSAPILATSKSDTTLLTNKRLSDVSEIPELTQNSSNESMRPSFIKRKLFTQTLDLAQEKDEQNDDSLPLNTPVPNIYSSVPRPRNKASNIVPRSLLRKNLFQAGSKGNEDEIRNLIEKIVPQEKMNATTGVLQRNLVRSSIHTAEPNGNKENCAGKINLLTAQPQGSDYDSDIFGPSHVRTQSESENNVEQPTEGTKQNPHKQNSKLDRLRNSINNYVTKPCNVALHKLTQSFKDNTTVIDTSKHAKEYVPKPKNTKINNATTKATKKIDVQKVENNLKGSKKSSMSESIGVTNKKIVNEEVRGNKRPMTGQLSSSKPNKNMNVQNNTKNKSTPASCTSGLTERLSVASNNSKSDDHEISFRPDTLKNQRYLFDSRTLSPNDSSLNSGVRRSTRKSIRPSRFFNYSMTNTPKMSSNSKNNGSSSGKKSAGSGKRGAPQDGSRARGGSAASQREHQRTPLTRSQARQEELTSAQRGQAEGAARDRSPSPTFTEPEPGASPRRTPPRPLNSQDQSSTGGKRRQARKDVNSARGGLKKTPSPVYKVNKRRITFGRKAKTPRRASPSSNSGVPCSKKVQNKNQAAASTAVNSFLETSSADEFTADSLQRSHDISNTSGRSAKKSKKLDLDCSITTRSMAQTGQKKSISPVYRVKKPQPSSVTGAKRPRANGQNKNVNTKPKNTRENVNAWLDTDSSENESGDKESSSGRPAVVLKPLPKIMPRPEAAPNTNNARTETTGTKQLVQSKAVNAKAVNAKVVTEKSPAKMNNNASHTFKPPPASMKAPGKPKVLNESVQRKVAQPRRNGTLASVSVMSSRSSVNSSKANRSVLPPKLRALLPSDWEEDYSDVEDCSIRHRVDRLSTAGSKDRFPKPTKAVRRKRDAVSPARSELSTKSEMVRPTKSLKTKAAMTFSRPGTEDVPRENIKRDVSHSQRLGMSAVTIGVIPSICRVDGARNASRFRDNASVLSSCSFRSTSSLTALNKKSFLHF